MRMDRILPFSGNVVLNSAVIKAIGMHQINGNKIAQIMPTSGPPAKRVCKINACYNNDVKTHLT